MTGLGFGDEFIKFPRFGVGLDFAIPHFFAEFLEPVGHRLDFLRRQFLNGLFNFSNCAHGGNLIQSPIRGNGFWSGNEAFLHSSKH